MRSRIIDWLIVVVLGFWAVVTIANGKFTVRGFPVPLWVSWLMLGWAGWIAYVLIKDRRQRKHESTDNSADGEE